MTFSKFGPNGTDLIKNQQAVDISSLTSEEARRSSVKYQYSDDVRVEEERTCKWRRQRLALNVLHQLRPTRFAQAVVGMQHVFDVWTDFVAQESNKMYSVIMCVCVCVCVCVYVCVCAITLACAPLYLTTTLTLSDLRQRRTRSLIHSKLPLSSPCESASHTLKLPVLDRGILGSHGHPIQ
jgi:hypothetical protein